MDGRFRFLLLALALLMGLISLFSLAVTRHVGAETLLRRAYSPPLPTSSSNYVLYRRLKTYVRLSPDRQEPTDPYHLPMLARLSGKTTIEQWALVRDSQIVQSKEIETDAQSGVVLFERVNDSDRIVLYDGYTGYTSVLGKAPGEALSAPKPGGFTDFARAKGLRIVDTLISDWGRPAWVVERREAFSPESAEMWGAGVSSFPWEGPYLSDLSATDFVDQWIIDQESEQMVQYQSLAITPEGTVLLKRYNYEPPAFLAAEALPHDWLNLSVGTTPVMDEATPPGSQTGNLITDLEGALQAADFSVFLPDIPPEYGLDRLNVIFKGEPEPREVWSRHWVFDIQTASAHGLALQLVYTSSLPQADTKSIAFVIIQGNRERLLPLMRQTPPVWAESHGVHTTINAHDVLVWVATGGSLSTPPPQIVAMFEIKDTFFFIIGQSYTQEQVLHLVNTLQPVKP